MNAKVYIDYRKAMERYLKFLDGYFPLKNGELVSGKPFDNDALKELQRLTKAVVLRRLSFEGSI